MRVGGQWQPGVVDAANLSGLSTALAAASFAASQVTSGVFDPARIPILQSQVTIISSGAIAALTTGQQAQIASGTHVTTTDGRRWTYTGAGSKTAEASYIELADVTPDWSVIANKPATFAPSAHTHATSDVTGLDTALAAKAPLASPGFTGTPTAPTPTAGDNSTKLATTAFVQANGGSTPLKVTVYTASGTWTPDPKMKFVKFRAVGGGGAGGSATGGSGAGGGGCGISAEAIYSAANAGVSQAITIGAAGAHAAAGNGNGGAGGDTSVGTLVTCPGGAGGLGAAAGTYKSTRDITSTSPGAATFVGAPEFALETVFNDSGAVIGSGTTGARGQHSLFGRGGAAGGSSNGGAATGYGAGGGGAGSSTSPSRFGGDGTAGLVIVEEFL